MCAVHVACGRLSPNHLTVNVHTHTHTYTEWAEHTHYAICLCHKHIKSAIKRIGSQMRHETIREATWTTRNGKCWMRTRDEQRATSNETQTQLSQNVQ